MAAIDVTRAEFNALLERVSFLSGEVSDVGSQFEKTRDRYAELENQVTAQYRRDSDLDADIRELESLNIAEKLTALSDELTCMQLQMTKDKTELVQQQRDAVGASDQERRATNASVEMRMETEKSTCEQELQEVGAKITELQSQGTPQPTEATATLMRELEEMVVASTARSLGKLKDEFDVVKLQVTENIGLNDDKFKKIDEQSAKGANDRKGRNVDRKTFHSSISKFSGSEGEPEIRGVAFELRQFLSKDDHYLEMMAWIEGIDGEFTKEIAEAKKSEMEGVWQFEEMDQQFYQVLVATAVAKSTAANKLMALEKRSGIPRGMMAYHDFTRELLGSTVSTRTMIANRVRNLVPIISLDDIEVRLLQWEADLEQLTVYEGTPSDTIKMGILKDMVPKSVRQVIRQQKPDSFAKLKQVLKDEAEEHRELTGAKKLKSKGLHAAEGDRWGPRQEDLPHDNP